LLLWSEPQRKFRDADVAGDLDGLGQCEIAGCLVGIRDEAGSAAACDGHGPGAPFSEHRIPAAHPVIHEQCGGGKQLGRGSRLERVGESGGPAGAHPRAAGLAGCQGEELAVGGIEEDYVATFCSHAGNGIVQSPLGDLLKLGVDGEYDVIPGNRLPNQAGRRVVSPAGTVLQQYRLARPASEDRIERELEPARSPRSMG
jgi:hypothetical protein